jgi:hypothetical protein
MLGRQVTVGGFVGVELGAGITQGFGVSPQERKSACLPDSPDSAVC